MRAGCRSVLGGGGAAVAREKKNVGSGHLSAAEWNGRVCVQQTRARAPPSRRSFALIHLHAHSSDTRAADSWGQKYNHEQRTVASFVLYCFLWLRAAAADLYIYIFFFWFSLLHFSTKKCILGGSPPLSARCSFLDCRRCWVICFAIKVEKANKSRWLVIPPNLCSHKT